MIIKICNHLWDWNLHIYTNSREIYIYLLDICAMLITNNDCLNCGKTSDCINITLSEDIYMIDYTKDNLHFEYIDYKQVIYTVYELILLSFNKSNFNRFALFHGGVVADNDKCYCFLAPTLTGKSTLTYNLCESEYKYMGDDHVIYDMQNNACISFPKPISIRNNTFINPKGKCFESIDFKMNPRYLYYQIAHIGCGESRKINAIFILHRGDNLPLEWRRYSCGMAYRELMFNSRENADVDVNQKAALLLANNCSVYSVQYSETKQVVKMLDELEEADR